MWFLHTNNTYFIKLKRELNVKKSDVLLSTTKSPSWNPFKKTNYLRKNISHLFLKLGHLRRFFSFAYSSKFFLWNLEYRSDFSFVSEVIKYTKISRKKTKETCRLNSSQWSNFKLVDNAAVWWFYSQIVKFTFMLWLATVTKNFYL